MDYESVVRDHEWVVPERFPIATEVCDKHPRDKLAMVHEHFDGTVRESTWREPHDLSCAGAADALPVAVASSAATSAFGGAAPAMAETVATLFGTWNLGALLLVDVGALRRRRHPPPARGFRREGAGHQPRQPDRFEGAKT